MNIHLADMTILDGIPSHSGSRTPDIELNFYNTEDSNKIEFFEFLCRDHSCSDGENPTVMIPISQIDNVIEMLQKVKAANVTR